MNTQTQTRKRGGAKAAMTVLALVGAIFLIVGLFFVTSQRAFSARSDAAQVTVTFVDRRMEEDGAMYRPTFEARASNGEVIEYSGGTWMRPKPHEVGDVVDGRVNWDSGEIRSASMMKIGSRLGIIFSVLGGIMLGTAVVIAGRMSKSTR